MKSKEQFRGTGKVFSFTLVQLLKSRANIIAMIIALLFSILSIPVISFFSSGNKKGGEELKSFYFENQTDFVVPDIKEALTGNENLKDLEIKEGKLPEGEKDAAGAVLMMEEGTPALIFLSNPNLSVEGSVRQDELMSCIYAVIDSERLRMAGFDEDTLRFLAKGSSRQIRYYDELDSDPDTPDYNEEDQGGFDQTDYTSRMGYSIFLMTLCMYAVGYIVRSVIEEKASKLVDLLLVSVKPAALLLGKVLAVLIYVILYMSVMVAGVMISLKISSLLFNASTLSGISAVFTSLNLTGKNLLIVLITSILGYVFFGLLAGLCGAGCSNMEEAGGAMSTCTLLIMAGYMVSIFTSLGNSGAAKTLSVLPVLSVFMAPVNYMKGQIGIGAVILSWGLQLASILLLIFLSARVYSRLIVYNGKRLNFLEIVKMAGRKEAEDEKAA